jgi:plasmid replication initiation protein
MDIINLVEHRKELELAKERENLVVKHNDLIQKKRFGLSALELKIVYFIISKIKPEDKDFKPYEFNIREFCRVCGTDFTNGGNYEILKTALKNLTTSGDWVDFGEFEAILKWISEVAIHKNSGNLTVHISPYLKPFLLQLRENFTNFSLYYTLPMKSRYSIRLFEILKSYEFRHGCELDVEDLKALMCAEHYTRFQDFRRKVIETAVKEINELSDINVTYEFLKKGRKFSTIYFRIKAKGAQERLKTYEKIECILDPQRLPGQLNLFD